MSVEHKIYDNSRLRKCKFHQGKNCQFCGGSGVYKDEHYIHVVTKNGKSIAIDADNLGK